MRFVGASDVLFFGKPEIISKIFSKSNIIKIFNKIKKEKLSKTQGPESRILEFIKDEGIKIFFLNYVFPDKFDILRDEKSLRKTKILRKILRFHLRKKYLECYLFSELLPTICRFRLSLGRLYHIDFAIGQIKKKKE